MKKVNKWFGNIDLEKLTVDSMWIGVCAIWLISFGLWVDSLIDFITK